MALNVLDALEFGGEGVIEVNGDDFPVWFAFVEEGHHAEYFGLPDLVGAANFFANFADVKEIIVAFCFLDLGGIFPALVARCYQRLEGAPPEPS